MSEVMPLLDALDTLELGHYSKISFHAPSKFEQADEAELAAMLYQRVPSDWPIVMHPDAIFDHLCWRKFGPRLAIENMDRRKPIGRNVKELNTIFATLPEARLCFDIGHARQYDSSMTEAFLILSAFQDKLVQVHVSEVNSESQHDAISYAAKLAFQQVAEMIGELIPVIVESRVTDEALVSETQSALSALTPDLQSSKSGQLKSIFDGLSSVVQSLSPLPGPINS